MKYGTQPMPDSALMNFNLGCLRRMPENSSVATVAMFDDGAMHTKISAPPPIAASGLRSFLPETMWISAGRPVSSMASQIGSHDGSGNGFTPGMVCGALGSEITLVPRPAIRRSSFAASCGSQMGRIPAPSRRSGSAAPHPSNSPGGSMMWSSVEMTLYSRGMACPPRVSGWQCGQSYAGAEGDVTQVSGRLGVEQWGEVAP